MKKIGLAAAASLSSVVLLFFFTLHNFPYGAIVKRLDSALARRYGASLSVGSVRHRYPMKVDFTDLRIEKRDGTFSLKASDAAVRLRLLGAPPLRTLELGGNGLQVKTRYIKTSKSRVRVLSKVRLSALGKTSSAAGSSAPDRGGLPIDYVSVSAQGTEVEKAYISGFEISSFKVPVLELVLQDENGFLSVKRGSVKSDLFGSEITGRMNLAGLDISIAVRMSAEFFRRYADLTGVFDQIGKDGSFRISIQGSTERPLVRVAQ